MRWTTQDRCKYVLLQIARGEFKCQFTFLWAMHLGHGKKQFTVCTMRSKAGRLCGSCKTKQCKFYRQGNRPCRLQHTAPPSAKSVTVRGACGKPCKERVCMRKATKPPLLWGQAFTSPLPSLTRRQQRSKSRPHFRYACQTTSSLSSRLQQQC